MNILSLKIPGKPALLFIVAVLWAVIWSADSYAELPKQNAAAAQALQKAQGMLRQLSQEKISLQAEKNALQERVKQLEVEAAKLGPLPTELERQKTRLAAAQAANAGLQTNLQNQAGKAAERERVLHSKLQEIVAQAELIQKDNQLLVAGMQEREQWIKQCVEKNQKLLVVNQELLDKYQDKGFWHKVADLEPFTGIGHVHTETAVQDYRFKLEDLKTVAFRSGAELTQSGPNDTNADLDSSVQAGQ
ncbi:MAG: hypothetical protein ABL925_15000 [Methylococcales bacterium]